MQFLEVKDLSGSHGGAPILSAISFKQDQFCKLAITGETGAGKSSLLKIIAGLMQPEEGAVYFETERVKGPNEKLIPGHPQIAYLSQQYDLPNFLRVEQVLEYANKLSEEFASGIFGVCRITHLMKRRTDKLSGGEKQRVAIARLLIGAPKLLLLDEPFSSLDTIHKTVLKSVIEEIGDKLQITCAMVSHSNPDTLSWADQIMVMKNGRIVQMDSPQNIYRKPMNEYVAGLFGNYNLLDLSIVKELVRTNALHFPEDKVFFRPEELRVAPHTGRGALAIITGLQYFGTHYDFALRLHEHDIIARMVAPEFTIGQEVNLSLPEKAVWQFPND
ncbi:MAG: ABC transporter ATP-binding protein [Gemmatimonadaceae bacterium]|nr:ABC transporter ATP-binding protein [Chitinophagaceae bacterium]